MNNVVKLNENTVYEDILTFLEDVRHRSENTFIRYKSAIELFFNWHTQGRGIEFAQASDINNLTYTRMRQFRNFLINERKNANSTINGTMSILYALFKELKKIDRNRYTIDIDSIQLKRLSESDSKSYGDITWEESEKIIEYVKSMPKRKMPKVKAALIHIARMTGIRLAGLLNLKYKDLRREHGVYVLHHSIKGKKHIQAIRDEEAQMMLNLKETDDDNEKIFKISSKTVERMMAEIISALNFDRNRNITFHSFRRLYGEEVYSATGNNIVITQQYLGHSNVNTTRQYVERKRDILNSPALYIGKEINENVVENLEKKDWQKLFNELSRSTQYEILNKIDELKLSQ